jgi:ABC-2 type transport system ATP-binding protein
MPAIRCAGLTKRFGGRPAVDGLNLEVVEGETLGFLGPNGAGKTTTIRLLLGLVRADAGAAWMLGERVPCPGRLAQVGSMIEEPAFYPWLSGRANLDIVADSGAPVAPDAVGSALERAGLAAVAGRKVKTYSQGMRQRLGLAAALLRQPRLLLLDEPANGLDPAGIHEFRTILRDLREGGTTVFLSSHLLAEVEQVSDRVAVMDRGRLVTLGTLAELARGHERVRVVVRPDQLQAAAALLGDHWTVQADGDGVLLVGSPSGREVNQALTQGGIVADSVAVDRAGLEERFLSLTGEKMEVGTDAPAPS